LKAWANLDMQLVAYVPENRQGEALPRQPLLRDFHMVGSGYDSKDSWESLLIPKSSDGKPAVGGGTKMNYRYYLQDMAYAVAMQGPTTLVEEAAGALASPVWDIYLGRNNCVPTEFVGQGVFETAQLAMQAGR